MQSESSRPRKYWNTLKTKIKIEVSELSQELGQLKMLAVMFDRDGRWL